MQKALELAAKAEGYTSPNPLVGAVVVKDGRIVGQGYHQKAGTPHAEVHALKDAGSLALGATIYVTLEPCCHYGRTPPCTEAIKAAGIKRVVAAMTDPNPLVAGQGLNSLKTAGIEVSSGILAEEAAQLNEVFIKYITKKLPFVALKAAVSLDGKIATVIGESQWITGTESRLYTHSLRHKYDGILVGINTVLADNPSLTTRLPAGQGKDPVRIILDSKCRTPLDAKIINQASAAQTIIATTSGADVDKIKALEAQGAEVIICGDADTVDLHQLLQQLAARKITSLLVEGGAGVHGSFLTSGLVDKVYWFIAPMLIGGDAAPGAVGGSGIRHLEDAVKLDRTTIRHFGKDICVEGYVAQGGGRLSLLE
ncbi:bifunctional diaminohydroxyphosphoribosylaminopyrimidine deaminase/5-amino-6-(5-phosphoribosylamino)uracil reductase RibD [Peptococcaceae bacterium 1198_IL3148]